MISLVPRSVLLSLGLLFVSSFVARPAHALISFWDEPVCSSPVDVSTGFTGGYGFGGKCASLCKTALAMCRAGVKSAVACQAADDAAFLKMITIGFCSVLEGAEKADCLMQVKQSKADDKASIAADKATGLANCGSFFDGCMMICTSPPA